MLGQGVKIGILDTGIDTSNSELKVTEGVSFVLDEPEYSDRNGHGTAIAGIISAIDDNKGIVGGAPKANIYAIKVANKFGDGTYSNLINGIEWAVQSKLDVINISLEGKDKSKTLKNAIEYAYKNNVMIVASAGNQGFNPKGNVAYPASYNNVIAVGAVDQEKKIASFSSVGKELALVAPGVDIISLFSDVYVPFRGTSMAAAHVTGAIALIKSKYPNLSNKKIEQLLKKSATNLGNKFTYGHGFLKVDSAIKQIRCI
ncbi:S8 family peptidase [Paenibacillus larvae]|uniref:S8 family peptidase n=1 Tax=Paenibacillus larvae TaxID=1464 RepID=UPI00227E27EC|nr:S8 family peptidase [Paenibacillus larvae]